MTIAKCILGLILELALRWHERCAAAGPATAARAFSKAQNKKSARRSLAGLLDDQAVSPRARALYEDFEREVQLRRSR